MEKIKTIWTIGHSTRPFEELIEMLRSFKIEIVADVRSYPGSRKFPQTNPDSKNIAWRHPAFRSYADYMETVDFKNGIIELEKIAHHKRLAYMCSEAVWWRCHRSMISDYLKAEGWKVMHIMAIGKETEHPYTAPAKIIDGCLTY